MDSRFEIYSTSALTGSNREQSAWSTNNDDDVISSGRSLPNVGQTAKQLEFATNS
jgi:hypothetical protein